LGESSAAIIKMARRFETKKFQPWLSGKDNFLLHYFRDCDTLKGKYMKCFLNLDFETHCAEVYQKDI
jgi:hypothetical protein